MPDLADTDNRQLAAGTWSANPGNMATADIKYDMVSKDDAVRVVETGTEKDENDAEGEIKIQKQDVLCRPWLANECEQIHFNAGAWLGQQQYLIYEKAWVDFEFDPARWYVFSSPLQDTKASDMYMPTDGARQLTEKFQGITFNTDSYDRFAPAVFQRSWNKSGTATVYELNGSSRDVAVEAAWSHVYNDVAEAYTPGIGFSVKADVSKAENIEEDSKVLIRLPKDDESVLYYTSYDNQTLEETKTIHSGDTQYKLNDASAPIEVELNYSNGNFFMVGNPYMCYLDMAAFLSENKDVIEPSYWIMNENAQGAAIYDEENGLLYGTAELAADVLPPMQGFFVKMKENVAEADRKVKFTTAMMKGGNDVTEKLSTRASEDSRAMIIRATDSRGDISSALLVNRNNASKGYNAAEDAVMILDSSFASTMQVYTSAGNVAAIVNTTCDADNTPLGVVAPEGEEVTLRFENAGVVGSLRLFDAVEGTYTPLTDDIEVTVTGNCSSRYFLVSSMPEASVDRIHISIEDGEVTVVTTAEEGNLHVNVCDIAGQVMRQFTNA